LCLISTTACLKGPNVQLLLLLALAAEVPTEGARQAHGETASRRTLGWRRCGGWSWTQGVRLLLLLALLLLLRKWTVDVPILSEVEETGC
jgi:hypothetical protein